MNFTEIEQLIARKIDLARELLDCSEKLRQISYSQNRNDFEHYLGKRAQIMEDFNKADVLLKNCVNKLEPSVLEEVKGRLARGEAQVRELLNQVLILDRENREHLSAEMAEIKQKLVQVRKGHQGRNAYMNQNRINAYGGFMDSRR